MIPIKHSLMVSAIFFSFSSTAISQVKKQYQDETFAQTTIVVKEENTAASDREILENQFDINDFGMDQVIRITTEAELPEVIVETEIAEISSAETAQDKPEAEIVRTAETAAAPAGIVDGTERSGLTEMTPERKTLRQGGSRSGRSSYSRKAVKVKRKKVRRFRQKNRKNKKKKKYGCYKF